MTRPVDSTARSAAPDINASAPTRPTEGTRAAAPPAMLPPTAGRAAAPLRTLGALAALEERLRTALASGDPEVLLSALVNDARTRQVDSARSGIAANRMQGQLRHEEQMRAIRRAADAEGASGFLGLLGRIAAAIAAAVGAVGSVVGAVFSGGTSVLGAVAIVGSVVAALGSAATEVLQATGAMKLDAVASSILSAVFCVLSLGAGAAQLGGTAVRVGANVAANAARAACTLVAATGNVAAGTALVGSAITGYSSALARADAQVIANQLRGLDDADDALRGTIANAMRWHQRVLSNLSGSLEARRASQMAAMPAVQRA